MTEREVHEPFIIRAAWIAEHGLAFPILVAEARESRVVGWTSISLFSPRECYAGIGYFSVYVDAAARGAGCGRRLVDALAAEARARSYWKLVSGIFSSNTASRRLCAACGFREVGTYERHAKLAGHWIDVVMVERLLR